MRARHLVFLVFVSVDGMSLDVAALNFSSTTVTAPKNGPGLYDLTENNHKLAEQNNEERSAVLELLPAAVKGLAVKVRGSLVRTPRLPEPQTNLKPSDFKKVLLKIGNEKVRDASMDETAFILLLHRHEKESLKRFFRWLRGVDGMDVRADRFLKMTAWKMEKLHDTAVRVWLERKVPPTEVLGITRQWVRGLDLWYRYTLQYRRLKDVKSVSVKDLVQPVMKAYEKETHVTHGYFFQALIDEGHGELAQLMRKELFHLLIAEGVKPATFIKDYSYTAKGTPQRTHVYEHLKAFTLQYVAATEGKGVRLRKTKEV
ncbi:unnamed protein product [Hyaloperonospora brassicae]|uniref:RxLR effector candidate protein n=1 Tax=Hyaloperonospora brassicae TaxID=162125 RepID=A0AAV0UI92_HYABA|nr:unnamed protein product [Hyaloperonospora brassicae]